MVRTWASWVVIVIACSAPTSVAGAGADSALSSRVSGAVSGEAPFDFTGCAFPQAHQQYITTVDVAQGKDAALVIDVCVDFPEPTEFVATGTFTFTGASGTLTGAANGTLSGEGLILTVTFTLSVSGGTRSFQHAAGTLNFSGVWASNGGNGGPVTGELTASLTRR
jgi:hypothetical protein